MFTQKQLHVFQAVMSTRSVSRAAERLNLSQPSVSRIIADIERLFGCALFKRLSKGVLPTPEAVAFLEEVDKQFRVLRNLEEVAQQIARNEHGKLIFATMVAASLEVVPRALARMDVWEKYISVSCYVKSSNWVIDFTRSGTISTGLATANDIPSGVRLLFEGSVPYVCLLPHGHPLAQHKQPLSINDLRDWQVVGVLGEVADALAANRPDHRAFAPMSAETAVTAIKLSEICGGVPVVDAMTAHDWLGHHAGTIRIVQDLGPYKFSMFEPSGIIPSALDREFQSCLVKEIKQIQSWADALYIT